MREESAHWQERYLHHFSRRRLLCGGRQREEVQIKYTDARATLTVSHKSPCSLSPSCPRVRFSGEVRKLFGYPPKSVGLWSIRELLLNKKKENNNNNTTFQNVILPMRTTARDVLFERCIRGIKINMLYRRKRTVQWQYLEDIQVWIYKEISTNISIRFLISISF